MLPAVSGMLTNRQPGPVPESGPTEIQKCTPQGGPVPPDHWNNGCIAETSAGLIQHSSVRPSLVPILRLDDAGTLTSALVPSKLKACPTFPETKPTSPCSVPLLP